MGTIQIDSSFLFLKIFCSINKIKWPCYDGEEGLIVAPPITGGLGQQKIEASLVSSLFSG